MHGIKQSLPPCNFCAMTSFDQPFYEENLEKKNIKEKKEQNYYIFNSIFFFLCRIGVYYSFTEKCDVYSFGVVALEILMGIHLGELLTTYIIIVIFSKYDVK